MKNQILLLLLFSLSILFSDALGAKNFNQSPAMLRKPVTQSYAQVLFDPSRPYALCAAYFNVIKQSPSRAQKIIASAPSPLAAKELFIRQIIWLKNSKRWAALYADEMKTAQQSCKHIDL